MRIRLSAILLATLLGGCGGVLSKNPASDGATTRFDERLVGFWRADLESTPGDKADPPAEESVLVVGRLVTGNDALQVMIVQLAKDKTILSWRGDLRPTKIGEKDYASMLLSAEGDGGKRGDAWSVLRYDMPDADTVRVLGMEEKKVAADVRAGEISGSVSESKEKPGVEPTLTVTLDASTAVLRAYLEKRADGIYRSEKPLVLRRLRLR